MFETIRTLLYVLGGLLALFLVLLSMPNSKLRELLVPLLGWGIAALSAGYVLMPLDALPDFVPFAGWVDDGGAIAVGISSAIAALRAGKKR